MSTAADSSNKIFGIQKDKLTKHHPFQSYSLYSTLISFDSHFKRSPEEPVTTTENHAQKIHTV